MKKIKIFQHQHQKQVKMCGYLYLFHGLYLYTEFLWYINQKKIKSSKKNMSRERALNFSNEKHFPRSISECCLLTNLPRITVACNVSPTSLDKISLLTWKLLFVSSQNFSFELNTQKRKLTFWKIFHICRCRFNY